jgi:hypothetical protein
MCRGASPVESIEDIGGRPTKKAWDVVPFAGKIAC